MKKRIVSLITLTSLFALSTVGFAVGGQKEEAAAPAEAASFKPQSVDNSGFKIQLKKWSTMFASNANETTLDFKVNKSDSFSLYYSDTDKHWDKGSGTSGSDDTPTIFEFNSLFVPHYLYTHMYITWSSARNFVTGINAYFNGDSSAFYIKSEAKYLAISSLNATWEQEFYPNDLYVYTLDNSLLGDVNLPSEFEFPKGYLLPYLVDVDYLTKQNTIARYSKPDNFGGYYDDEFAQYYNGNVAPVNGTDLDSSRTLKGYYKHNVTLDTRGGIVSPNGRLETYVKDGFYLETVETPLPSNVTKKGYTFAGWYDNEECEGTQITSIPSSAREDVKYYAKWDLNTYSISYDLAEGVNNPKNPATYTFEDNTIYLEAPTREHYLFQGWTDDEGNSVAMIKKNSVGDVSLHANWKLDPAYEVETFIENYMHPEIEESDVSSTNQCAARFAAAKEGYAQLSDEAKELFNTDEEYEPYVRRLQEWARINGEILSNDEFTRYSTLPFDFKLAGNNSILVIGGVITCFLVLVGYLVITKKKQR